MNNQFPLFTLSENTLHKIFSYLTDEEYITMLTLYEKYIPQTISKIRLNETFGNDIIIEEKIKNRGWHYITKNLLQYSKNQSIQHNLTDNRYFIVENNTFIPLTSNQMTHVTHIAEHSFGRHKKLHYVKNYENQSIVVQNHINYFEVSFEANIETDMTYEFAIGLCHSGYDKKKFLGWQKHSIAYHSDDGKLFHESGSGKSYSEKYGKGDTVGCGFDTIRNIVFFTKNGKRLGDVTVEDKILFPAISFGKWKTFTVNFGEQPFVYDVYGFKPIVEEEIKEEEEDEGKNGDESKKVTKLLSLLTDLLRDLGGDNSSSSSSSSSSESDDDDDDDEEEDDDDNNNDSDDESNSSSLDLDELLGYLRDDSDSD